MKIVLLAFATFVLAGVSLLPHLIPGLTLFESYPAFSSVLIMLASIFILLQGLAFIRQQFRFGKISHDRDLLEDELQETVARLHREKRSTTELRAQIVSLERSKRREDTQEELAQLKADRLALEMALAKSQQQVTELEDLLAQTKATPLRPRDTITEIRNA